MAGRIAYIERKTNETDIKLELHIDGSGQTKIDTGIGFFDHMLNSFARHGFFDLKVLAKGDLYVDSHHTIEDTGIVLGPKIRAENLTNGRDIDAMCIGFVRKTLFLL